MKILLSPQEFRELFLSGGTVSTQNELEEKLQGLKTENGNLKIAITQVADLLSKAKATGSGKSKEETLKMFQDFSSLLAEDTIENRVKAIRIIREFFSLPVKEAKIVVDGLVDAFPNASKYHELCKKLGKKPETNDSEVIQEFDISSATSETNRSFLVTESEAPATQRKTIIPTIKTIDEHKIIRYTRDGKYHREDGPAIITPSGIKLWYKDGQRHRMDGPAVENPCAERPELRNLYYINGVHYKDPTSWFNVLSILASDKVDSRTQVIGHAPTPLTQEEAVEEEEPACEAKPASRRSRFWS